MCWEFRRLHRTRGLLVYLDGHYEGASNLDAFQEHSEVFESQITHLDYESRSSRIPRLIKRNSRDVELFRKRAAMH